MLVSENCDEITLYLKTQCSATTPPSVCIHTHRSLLRSAGAVENSWHFSLTDLYLRALEVLVSSSSLFYKHYSLIIVEKSSGFSFFLLHVFLVYLFGAESKCLPPPTCSCVTKASFTLVSGNNFIRYLF